MPFLFSVERRPSSFVINLFNVVISENSKLLSSMIMTIIYYYLKTSTAKAIGKLSFTLFSHIHVVKFTKQLFLFSFLRYIFRWS